VPAGPDGELIRRGQALALDTRAQVPDHVGNGLNCTNCHLNGGTVAWAAPWVGMHKVYPKHRSRSAKTDDLPDRINDCFERSMDGKPLARDSAEMAAMVAYMTWLGQGVPEDGKVAGQGFGPVDTSLTPDPDRGAQVYAAKCQSCHQAGGLGLFDPAGKTLFPALGGERAFNIAAGMARLHTAAAFVKWNMPLGAGGSLTDQEAMDVALHFTRLDRPDFADKVNDWPQGGKPVDARY
jgi:thiosulfate dehydrogenase